MNRLGSIIRKPFAFGVRADTCPSGSDDRRDVNPADLPVCWEGLEKMEEVAR